MNYIPMSVPRCAAAADGSAGHSGVQESLCGCTRYTYISPNLRVSHEHKYFVLVTVLMLLTIP
jgi:hypothetical protein